jgi:Amt family ammonium transporter
LKPASFFLKQTVSVLAAVAYAFVFTYVMLWVINKFTKVRVSEKEEDTGLDETIHGETAYI